MNDISFGCTLCGRCCHGHSLPLTLQEAEHWNEDGGKVGIFCEAHLERNEESPLWQHRRRRSFAVSCGQSQARVTAILVAIISGPCPNLRGDLRCGIYERRPLVCRIYPAEISPFIELNMAAKACPPEAWVPTGQTLLLDGKVVDPNLRSLIDRSRQTDRDDIVQKRLVCSALKLSVAALAEEGYVVYEPDPTDLLAAFEMARNTLVAAIEPIEPIEAAPSWSLYSPDIVKAESLRACGFQISSAKAALYPYTFLYAPPLDRPLSESVI